MIDKEKIKRAAEVAKTKTSDKRWINAIDKAVAGVESGWWIITELAHSVAITTECGNTYFANGVCQCEAFRHGQPCKHRALARLIEIANEADAAEQAARRCDAIIADIKTIEREIKEETAPAVSTRQEIITKIKTTWSAKFPTANLADALMARFRKNRLEMLADDMLQGVLTAIAM